jgi:pyruvate/2-oxoglutarate/acetoin dehydrogenase E1 component
MERTWILGSRRENVTRDGGKLHSDELHNYLGDEMEESEGVHDREQKCIKKFGQETCCKRPLNET